MGYPVANGYLYNTTPATKTQWTSQKKMEQKYDKSEDQEVYCEIVS